MEAGEEREVRCVFCLMFMAAETTKTFDLRVSLQADTTQTLYANVFIPTCRKHEHIYLIIQRATTHEHQ